MPANPLALAKQRAQQKALNLQRTAGVNEASDFDDDQSFLAAQRTPAAARLAAQNAARPSTVATRISEQAAQNARGNPTSRTNIGRRSTAPNDETIKQATGGLADGSGAGQLSPLDNAQQSSAEGIPVTTTQGIKIESRLDNLNIPDNVLLNYVSLQYHIALSMVPKPNAVNIQRKLPIGALAEDIGSFDELQRRITGEGSVPLASTGDVFQGDISEFFDIVGENDEEVDFSVDVSGRNYHNIQSLVFDNVMAPTAQNPFVAAMLNGKLVIVEPHGFKFKEDLTRVGNKIGYEGINPGRFLYRIDIFFSGYDQDTGEWVPFIELDTRVRKTKVLTYYVNFTTVEAKLDHTGTTYDISFAPSGHAAYRPEEITLNSGAIATGNRSLAETFGGFLDRMSQSMEKAVRDRTHGQVKRKYEFKAPPELLSAPFFTGDFEFKKGFIANDPKRGSFLTPARDVNVISIVEDALQDVAFVWNEFLKKDDKKHLKPRIHWNIRFNVIYDSGPNPGTGDFDIITIQYIIEPFITYKKARMNNRDDMVAIMDPQAQARRVEEMLRFGMINRIYNYINTSENLEVIDFDVSLKAFYYHTMYKPKDSPAGAGNFQPESGGTKGGQRTDRDQQARQTGTSSDQQGSTMPRTQENSVQSSLRRLFGREIDNPAAVCDSELFKTPFDRYGGGYGEMPTSDFTSMVGAQDQNDRDEYKANVNDHIKNDLLTINMQVRGDPLWLLSPYGVDSGTLISTSTQNNNIQGSTALVRAQSSRCFFLRMFSPEQRDYMNPDRQAGSTACSIIGGFYEVLKVASKFEGGKFTQAIEAYKIPHLNYIENFIYLATNSQVDTSPPQTGGSVPQRNSPPNIGGT